MTRLVPWVILATGLVYAAESALPRAESTDGFQFVAFGRLPVSMDGRVQPVESMARTALMKIGRTTGVPAGEGHALEPTEWLMEVLVKPHLADERAIFPVEEPDLRRELDPASSAPPGVTYYSFKQLAPHLEQIAKRAEQVSAMRAENRSASERELLTLLDAVILYQRLKNGFQPNTFLQLQTGGKPIDYDLAVGLARHRTQLPAGTAALKAREHGQPFDEGALTSMMEFLQPYETVARVGLPLLIPPADPAMSREGWVNVGTALRDSLRIGEIAPPITHMAAIATAYMRNVPADFNRHVSDYQAWLATNGMESALHTSASEIFYIRLQPSMKAAALYVAAFILCFAFWTTRATFLYRSALLLGGLALVLHTTDLSFRILMEGRPPLTSVYSSTIFVGWCAVMLGVAVEAMRRNGVGILTSALVGVTALIAAGSVAVNGGAIEALRATLANNLWLAGHVGLVSLGYAAALLAGVVAAVYIVLGVFTRWLSTKAANELDRLVYRLLVAALVFTAAGTMMGGFWADRVWGRFWSWDPKESGALLIILWTIITLQLRWQQVAGQRAQITMAAAGLIVLTVPWFGVGMMSVGLHSYGFMPQQFGWLATLVAMQATVVGFGLVPLRYWRSRTTASETPLEHYTVPAGPAVDVRTRHWTEIFKLHSQQSVTEPPSETN